MVLRLRSSLSPPAPANNGTFTFALSPPPESGPSKRYPPPSYRFPDDSGHVFGQRPLEESLNESSKAIFRCKTCDRAVMAGAVLDHEKICEEIQKRLEVKAAASAAAKMLAVTPVKKAKLAREGSLALSDATPTKKAKPREASLKPPPSLEPGTVDEEGRMILENGKRETKKNMQKRMAQERRDQKATAEGKDDAEGSPVADPLTSKLKDQKEKRVFSLDRNCGVINQEGIPCPRRIDCKLHRIEDKRAVPGRPMGYDECMAAFVSEKAAEDKRLGKKSGLDGIDVENLTAAEKLGEKRGRKRKQRMDTLDSKSFMNEEDEDMKEAEFQEFIGWYKVQKQRVCNLAKARSLGLVYSGSEAVKKAKRNGNGNGASVETGSGIADDGLVNGDALGDGESNPIIKPAPKAASLGFSFLQPLTGQGPPLSATEDQQQDDPMGMESSNPEINGDASNMPPSPVTATHPNKPAPGVESNSKSLINTMRFQTFAGGSVSGVWHLERRKQLPDERIFGDILGMLQHGTRQKQEALRNGDLDAMNVVG